MAKPKTQFSCQNCGSVFSKWQGQCSSCKEWNVLVEEVVEVRSKKIMSSIFTDQKPVEIESIDTGTDCRLSSGSSEFNRVLGGGLVAGAVILLSGDPGIGKSTLMLQIALKFEQKTLYVSGEESRKQIKMRADRILKSSSDTLVFTETGTQSILEQMGRLHPELVIVDSIQTLYSNALEASSGSVSQIRQCTSELTAFAKKTGTPIIIIGHVTKDGHIAGPKVLEHMVDVVLQFEGDKNYVYRILRSVKNRFGSTSELGIFEMQNSGLKEVVNPSEILISKSDEAMSGTSIASTMEGMRPLMIEVQSLVSSAVYGTPQRTGTGFNVKRLNMLLAVLEKRAGFRLGAKDVFLNITGGISVDDPAIDLAVVMAILSSNEDIPISKTICFAAEVGLSGEIRPVQRIDQRISEAEKLGFERIFISKYAKCNFKNPKISVYQVGRVEEVIGLVFS